MPVTTPRLDGAFVLRYRYISHVLQGRSRAGFEREAQYSRVPGTNTISPITTRIMITSPTMLASLFVHGGLDMGVHRPSSI